MFVTSEGDEAQKGQSETKYLLFNFQWGSNEFCLVASNSFHYRVSKM